MPDPYKMVFISIFSVVFSAIAVLIYQFIYPKKKIPYPVLLLIISFLPLISIFRAGVYESGDFNLHIYRTMEFYHSLSEGNIIPSWAQNLNATYGYPLFMFNYTLPYYFLSLLKFLGFTYIVSMKIFLALSFIFSGVFMYLFAKNVFKKDLAAFASSVFYLFTPYHLISLNFKVTIGEILAFTFLPLVLFFTDKFFRTYKLIYLLLTALSFALLSLSHIFIAIFSFFIITSYVFFLSNKSKLKNSFYLFIIFLISLLISGYNIFPSIIYKKYMFLNLMQAQTLAFPKISELLYSPWRAGLLFQGPYGEISSLIGYTQLVVVVVIIFLLVKSKIEKKYIKPITYWGFLTFLFVFLITPFSKFFWDILPLINIVGAHRLLLIIAFCISILAGYLVLAKEKNIKLIYVLLAITVLYTILNWGNRKMLPQINDSALKTNLPISTYNGEKHFYANTRWVDKKDPWFLIIPEKEIEGVSEKVDYTLIKKTSTKHLYKINTLKPTLIRENTLYFPTWTAKIDNKPVNIWPDSRGAISLKTKTGEQYLELTYSDFPIYNLIKLVSLFSLSVITFISIYLFIKKKY